MRPFVDDAFVWAAETLGDVDLGDARRSKRLLKIAASLARSPSGTVSAAMQNPAEREAAFRFLASEHFGDEQLGDGLSRATLARTSGLTYCPVDGASISLSDVAKSRDVGGVGTWKQCGRGLHAITALAADAAGTPVGVLGPQWWARTERRTIRNRKKFHALRTETRHVVAALRRIEASRRSAAAPSQLWFQLDRGFDAWPVFQVAQELELLVTVRSSWERRIWTEAGTKYLIPTLDAAPIVGICEVDVPEREERLARVAKLEVRIAHVQLVLEVAKKRREYVAVSAVSAVEVGYRGADALNWRLLTTAKVTDLNAACAVIRGYTTRWLIEDLHRAWKRGWTKVEQTQLRRRNSLSKWATLHLALASRALRLSRLARSDPRRSSSAEFSRDEIDAVLLLKQADTKYRRSDDPPLADLVLLLAEIGGYDRYSRKPAGATVIGRGLSRIEPVAHALELLRQKSD